MYAVKKVNILKPHLWNLPWRKYYENKINKIYKYSYYNEHNVYSFHTFTRYNINNEIYKDMDVKNKYYMFNQIRNKKNRKKRERVTLNDEQKNTKLKLPIIRLEDRTTVCETPSVISKNIKKGDFESLCRKR